MPRMMTGGDWAKRGAIFDALGVILAKERQNYVHLSKAEAISRALGRLLRWSFWTLALLIFLLLVLLAMLLYPTVQT